MPTLDDVRLAMARIGDQIVRTPCPRSHSFPGSVDGTLFLKLENRQRTGSFKDRGACNRLMQLSSAEAERGVITASAGNHAQALAMHAQRLGVPCTVVMPETSPLIKVSNTRGFGARVFLRGATLSDGLDEVLRLADEEGLTAVSAFDDDHVIAGQGTIGLEILEQVPEVDTIVVPVGGGGMISGIATAVKALRPDVSVIGVEAEAAPSAHASRAAGRRVTCETTETLADGIAVKRVGERTFPIIERLVDDLVTVSEAEIAGAIFELLEREKTVVEGAAATVVAALSSGYVGVAPGQEVVAVLSGGNIDVNMIARLIDRGLVADGRLTRLRVDVRDRPGYLAGLTRVVAAHGANVLHISHRRAFGDITVGDVGIVMQIETRGRSHVEELIGALESEGHRVEEEV